MKKSYSPSEIAKLLGVSLRTIYREIERGKLKSAAVGSRKVITIKDLEDYLGEDRARALIRNGNGK